VFSIVTGYTLPNITTSNQYPETITNQYGATHIYAKTNRHS
jgi:hypothetical protein